MGPAVYVWDLSDLWSLETIHETAGYIWSLQAVYGNLCQNEGRLRHRTMKVYGRCAVIAPNIRDVDAE